MIPLDEALQIIERELAGREVASEILPVKQALGRVCAADQFAGLDVPPFNKSAMDGYAVLDGDQRDEYEVIDAVQAGVVPAKDLAPGTAVKVMTGAPVPDGAGSVIMVEHTQQIGEKIRVLQRSQARNICRKGEDVRTGDLMLKAPATLGPAEIGNLISVGITEVPVAERIKVAILSTGNEIVDSPDQITPGKIMNSNGPVLRALCEKHGLEVVIESIVPDSMEATVSSLKDAMAEARIVIFSGGVSMGDYDLVPAALSEVGFTIHFDRLAVKPGKPTTFATSAKSIVFGLPGNPVAVFLMFHLFVLRAAGLLTGFKRDMRCICYPLQKGLRRRDGERQGFLPATLSCDGMVEPVEYHGTAHLRALLAADGFFIVPRGVTEMVAGDKVRFVSLKGGFE